MRSRASGVARLEAVAALMLIPAFYAVVHVLTFYGRATPDARERIPTTPHAQTTARRLDQNLGSQHQGTDQLEYGALKARQKFDSPPLRDNLRSSE